jgi:hypothetical protein
MTNEDFNDICDDFNRKLTLSAVRKLIKDKEKTEITRDRGCYYVLHICKNNVPVPL